MEQILRILNLEDDPVDSELASELLSADGLVSEIDRVDTLADFQEALEQCAYSLILSDYTIPGVDSLEALRLARQMRPEVPFIFLSGTMGEDQAIETLKMGASDYVLKQRIARLAPAVRRAIQEAEEQSRRKKAEEELRKARDELEIRVRERTAELETAMRKLKESNQALQEFASIASHDLQEPLRKVKSFGEKLMIKYAASLGDKGKDYLERMLNATNRMQALLTSLLDYSRVTTRAQPFIEVSLNDVIREVLSDLEARIEQTGGRVQLDDLPAVEADPTQMRQLFQNLIGNGLKYHKESEKPLVRVSAREGKEHYQILVEDNGIGFDEQHLDKIFAPFQRLHSASSSYKGTGMGLAICKKIVERHSGMITARSTPGQGSVFIVTLPKRH